MYLNDICRRTFSLARVLVTNDMESSFGYAANIVGMRDLARTARRLRSTATGRLCAGYQLVAVRRNVWRQAWRYVRPEVDRSLTK